ncbi:endoglucanase [Archangium minus]|uniref:Endoglucanase n=1 Tax=Archangium minus TaxID=83450 RepID=A0ABY9WQJ9_9BACT|nr:endoglucanase [Archangium minus]
MGLFASATATAEPDPTNRPPVLTAGPSASATEINEQTSVDLFVSASDPDNDPLTYTWEWEDLNNPYYPQPGSFSSTTVANPSWTAPNIHFSDKVYLLKVTVSDGRGGTVQGSVPVSVLWVNQPPAGGTLTGPTTLESGQRGMFSVDASDPDGDRLWYAWVQQSPASPVGSFSSIMGPEGSQFATMYWTAPVVSQETLFTLRVWVGDDYGDTVDHTLTVRVTPPQTGAPLGSTSM